MRNVLLPAGLAVLTLSCGGGPSGPTVPLDRAFTLSPGESTHVEDAGFSVRFLGVFGDSRCPADAVCILGGDASVRISVTAGRASLYELHTGDERPVTHDGFTIALVQLDPYPFSAQPIQPEDYRATLRVTR